MFFWLSNAWHLDVKTVSSNCLSALGSSEANLLIEEKEAFLMCVALSVFVGDLRQTAELLRELRCVIQRQQAGERWMSRDGTGEDGSASARCLGL